jgi:putative ABC transport system substrate-binding protein
MPDVRRRELMALLGAAAAWPLAARAEQASRLPTIGLLGSSTPSAWAPWIAAFQQRLRELGWIEGRSVTIEYRWAEGRNERGAEIAAEFAMRKVDVIVTTGGSALAVKEAISAVPVVFALWSDPIGSGYVASLARPGGNATGLSHQSLDTAAKRLELLHEVVPDLRRLAVLARLDNPSNVVEAGEVEAAARTLGLEITTLNAKRAEEIVSVIEPLKGRVDALHIVSDPLLLANGIRINTLAIGARLPTMYGYREGVETGGLISYGANMPNLWRRAAEMVDKILRGTKPGAIPSSASRSARQAPSAAPAGFRNHAIVTFTRARDRASSQAHRPLCMEKEEHEKTFGVGDRRGRPACACLFAGFRMDMRGRQFESQGRIPCRDGLGDRVFGGRGAAARAARLHRIARAGLSDRIVPARRVCTPRPGAWHRPATSGPFYVFLT